MTRYSFQPNIHLSYMGKNTCKNISKNLSSKYSQNYLDHATLIMLNYRLQIHFKLLQRTKKQLKKPQKHLLF